jgi:hypothetical protein
MRARVVALFVAIVGCEASEPDAPLATSGGEETDSAALARAKEHPVAKAPARSLYPEKAPPAEPTASASAPAAATSAAQTNAAAPREPARTVAPQAPPSPREEPRPGPPEPSYVWAPGYWYWYSDRYVWVDGAWLPPRPGYTYLSAHWVWADGGWVLVPGGWAVVGTRVVVYPVYRHHHYYPPRRSYWHGHHYRETRYRHPHYRTWRGGSRDGYRGSSRYAPGGTVRTYMRRR